MEKYPCVNQLMCIFRLQLEIHMLHSIHGMPHYDRVVTDCSPQIFALASLMTSGKQVVLCNVDILDKIKQQKTPPVER